MTQPPASSADDLAAVKVRPKRQSIEPTYDVRDTGPRYYVTAWACGNTVTFQEAIADPFIRSTVTVGWRDVLRCALRRKRVSVEVTVGADRKMVEDVLELDGNYLGSNCTRRDEFNVTLGAALTTFAASDPPSSDGADDA